MSVKNVIVYLQNSAVGALTLNVTLLEIGFLGR